MHFFSYIVFLQCVHFHIIQRCTSPTSHDISDAVSYRPVIQVIVSLKYQPDPILFKQGMEQGLQIDIVAVEAYRKQRSMEKRNNKNFVCFCLFQLIFEPLVLCDAFASGLLALGAWAFSLYVLVDSGGALG